MSKIRGRAVFGFLLIALGVISLLNSLGFTRLDLAYLINLAWPLLLVGAGINFIATRRDAGGLATGALILGLGALFFARNAGLFDFDMGLFWRGFWPVIIILIGFNLLFKNQGNSRGQLAFMGALEKKHEAWDLKSGAYTAFMGGIELDVRKARFVDREISLDLTAVMGGITVILPEDVAVTCTSSAVLGGVDLLGKGSGGIFGSGRLELGDPKSAARVIHLDCTSIMGGIEIKH